MKIVILKVLLVVKLAGVRMVRVLTMLQGMREMLKVTL